MLFNSFVFAGFFAVTYAAYVLTMRRLGLQNALLLVASYYFYGSWDWRFLGLLILSTVVDFACGLLLDLRVGAAGSDATYRLSHGGRRLLLMASVGFNLGVLGFFKYYDFFAGSCAAALASLGVPVRPALLHVVLPVGISFYTFQTMSYTIDVYRGELRACRSPLDFALFVAFFPQLVAGPIVRAADFLPQVSRPRRLDARQVYEGVYLVFWGLFKKVVIADKLAGLVDGVFSGGPGAGGAAVLVAVYAFSVQIYCDFSGYSDIARGCAKTMGFELRLNFNLPYFAATPSEFWQRWHISLSSWLRDYLYIPLGGNRRGATRTCINLLVTMLLGGLWHGAAWTFVAWGLYHGLLLIAYKHAEPWFAARVRGWPRWGLMIGRCLAVLVFFHVTCGGWLLFRAEGCAQAAAYAGLVAGSVPVWIAQGLDAFRGSGVTLLLYCGVPLLAVQLLQRRGGDLNALLRISPVARGAAYAAMFYALILLGEPVGKPFIYFQF
ncbi:MAG: MBOAT family protein [Planctomycetes bacterium]|nr:MBOAT family protein [Planctomycetota bacterium]